MKRKVLVTGGCGFIGSHLAERLVRSGCDVTVFDKYNFDNRIGHLESSKYREDIRVVLGDIRDQDSFEPLGYKFDQIFHLAALISIPYSYITPQGYINTNIIGTNNLLAFSRRNSNLQSLMITSTSEVYGTPRSVPISESHVVNSQSPYAASKTAADQLSLSYFYSFDLPVKIIRPFNTYGPRQSERAIIPTVISQLLAGNVLRLGRTDVTRDFTYVEDTAAAFEALANIDRICGEIVNVGSGTEISVSELVSVIGRILNIEPRVEEDSARLRPDASEVLRLNACTKKIYSISAWRPEVDLFEGLERTIAYLRENARVASIGKYRY